MILVDVNILLYAVDRLSPQYEAAREWWNSRLSGSSPIGLCWPVISAFIRIATNSRIFKHPLPLDEALGQVQTWLTQPCTRIIHPTQSHWAVFQQMLRKGEARGNLVSDAHLAALAVEHGCELCSTDVDFSRFPDLKWKNPLKESPTRPG